MQSGRGVAGESERYNAKGHCANQHGWLSGPKGAADDREEHQKMHG